MISKLKKYNKLSIILYLLAIIFLIAFIFSFYDVTKYLFSLYTAGTISFANWFECILYYINNTLNYLGFSLIILGTGYLINLLKPAKNDYE